MTFDDYYTAVSNATDAEGLLSLEDLYNNLVLWNRPLATAAWYAATRATGTYQGDPLTNIEPRTRREINPSGRWPITARAAWFGHLATHWPQLEESAA